MAVTALKIQTVFLNKVVVDTNVIVALIDAKDTHHSVAQGMIDSLEG